jgi:hypothetical protein
MVLGWWHRCVFSCWMVLVLVMVMVLVLVMVLWRRETMF